jgi:hypothetical protein
MTRILNGDLGLACGGRNQFPEEFIATDSMQALAKNGVLVLARVTGGDSTSGLMKSKAGAPAVYRLKANSP